VNTIKKWLIDCRNALVIGTFEHPNMLIRILRIVTVAGLVAVSLAALIGFGMIGFWAAGITTSVVMFGAAAFFAFIFYMMEDDRRENIRRADERAAFEREHALLVAKVLEEFTAVTQRMAQRLEKMDWLGEPEVVESARIANSALATEVAAAQARINK
jgi:hypothetical protein